MSAKNHIDLLGKKAKDKVTGFTGVLTGVSFDLYGCIQVVITPELDKDGKIQDGRWLDINRVEITDENRVMPVPQFAKEVKYGATPASHTHGPAEKPARKL